MGPRKRTPGLVLAVLGITCLVPPARAERVSLTHGGWEMYSAPVVRLSSPASDHGDPALYRHAPALPPPGSAWTTLTGPAGSPRNPIDIDYLGPNDDYSSSLRSCLTELQFTSFACGLTLPAGFLVSTAVVTLGPLDDGARVLVINHAYPGGVVPEDGYLGLGDQKAVNLSKWLTAGETNRIVVQHLDDCGGQSWLGTVEIEVTGEAKQVTNRPSWGLLKSMYR